MRICTKTRTLDTIIMTMMNLTIIIMMNMTTTIIIMMNHMITIITMTGMLIMDTRKKHHPAVSPHH